MFFQQWLRSRRLLFAAAFAATLGLASPTANASTATGSIVVSATVLSVCIVVATPLAFGNYEGSSGTAATSTATVTVTCSLGTPFTVALGAGNGTGATVASRVMASGSNTLNYNLYTTSGYSTIWGDGTNSTSTQGATAGALPTVYTVYGKIPANQYASAGIYGDAVTVTVTY